MQLISPDGDLIDVDRSHPDFDGMVIALGALGPVVRITLDIEPSYQVQQDGYANLSWDAIVGHFDQVSNAGYSVSVMTMWAEPSARQVWVKTRLGDDHPRTNLADLGATPIPVADLGHGANMNPFGSPGPWSRRLPHFRLDSTPSRGHEIQVEWMVPRSAFPGVALSLREHGDLIDSMLVITELRTVAGDDQWLSPTQGQDVVGVHFTCNPDTDRVLSVLHVIEPILLAAGGRPHWGKFFLASAAELAPRYPQLDRWLRLRDRFDPGHKFGNAFIADHLTG